MGSIDRQFLYRLEDEVNRARQEINEKHMGLADIKARLAHIVGIENLTVEQSHGKEIYHLGEQIVEVPANNAGVRSRVQLLADGLKALAKVDEAVAAIQTETTEPKPERPMSVTGIQSGAFQAKLAEMREKIANKQTEALTKIDSAVESGAAKMNAAVDDVVNKADREVDAALHEFAQFTNGGPV